MIEGPTWPTLEIALICLPGSCKDPPHQRPRHFREESLTHEARVLQAAARPALLSRRQRAGQKGCRHEDKLTKDASASQKAISADTPYTLGKPVC